MTFKDDEESRTRFPLQESAQRYDEFLQSLRQAKLLTQEMLLPTLELHIPNVPRSLMLKREIMDEDYRSSLQQDMAALAPWDYSIYLGSGLYTGKQEKAELLKSHIQINNASFSVGDIYDLSGSYDIVYNLGLLYHVTDPYKLMQITYDKRRTLAVVDTLTHLAPVRRLYREPIRTVACTPRARTTWSTIRPTVRLST